MGVVMINEHIGHITCLQEFGSSSSLSIKTEVAGVARRRKFQS